MTTIQNHSCRVQHAAVVQLCLPNVLWFPAAELQCPAELCPAEFPAEQLHPAILRKLADLWKPTSATVSNSSI